MIRHFSLKRAADFEKFQSQSDRAKAVVIFVAAAMLAALPKGAFISDDLTALDGIAP